jgi:hypothetical protein
MACMSILFLPSFSLLLPHHWARRRRSRPGAAAVELGEVEVGTLSSGLRGMGGASPATATSGESSVRSSHRGAARTAGWCDNVEEQVERRHGPRRSERVSRCQVLVLVLEWCPPSVLPTPDPANRGAGRSRGIEAKAGRRAANLCGGRRREEADGGEGGAPSGGARKKHKQ